MFVSRRHRKRTRSFLTPKNVKPMISLVMPASKDATVAWVVDLTGILAIFLAMSSATSLVGLKVGGAERLRKRVLIYAIS